MSEVKMSDVFKGKVVVDEIVGNRKQGEPRFKLSDSGVFRCGLTKDGLKHAAYAINNHDRLQQENAELREALREARGAISAFSIQESRNDGTENRMKINALNKLVSKIDTLLNK